MDRRWRLSWTGWCVCWGLLLALSAQAGQAALSLSVLPTPLDPPPAQVLAGRFDAGFVPVPDGRLQVRAQRRGWWRLEALQDIPAGQRPQLVVHQPHSKHLELWRPGWSEPLARSIYGPDSDYSHSVRFLVFPLKQGLRRGDVLYLRAVAAGSLASRIQVLPLQEVYARDIDYVALRTLVLTVLSLIAALAFGLWAGLGERGYVYLGLSLGFQVAGMLLEGGEARSLLPLPAQFDRRFDIALNTAAVLAGVRFIGLFLGLRRAMPWVQRLLDLCSLLLAALLLSVLAAGAWQGSVSAGNLLLLVALALIGWAILGAVVRGHREGHLLLVAWAPLIAVLVVLVGAYQQWWPAFAWLEYAYPASLAFGGLGLLLGLTSQVQQLRRARDRAEHRASVDALTGVLARSALEEALAGAVARARHSGRPLALLFFDIDHFKRLNDALGHRGGDEALRIIALRCRNRLRPDDVLGRYGGDEMVAVLPDTGLGQAERIAELLREGFAADPLSIEGQTIAVGLSIGVAELEPGEGAEQLLRRADDALYASKTGGRDRVSRAAAAPA